MATKVSEASKATRRTVARRGAGRTARVGKAAADSFVSRGGRRAAKAAAQAGWNITKYLPKAVVKGFSKLNGMLHSIPGYAGLNIVDKGFIFLQSAMDLYQAGKDTTSGFTQEQGNLFDKVTSGVMSGVKSFGKAAGVMVASTLLASKLPILMGGGVFGFIAGMVGTIGGSMLTRFVLDKVMPTHGHIQGMDEADPSKATPNSGEDVMRQIDYTWRNKTFDPNARIPSEWLNVDRNFKPSRL